LSAAIVAGVPVPAERRSRLLLMLAPSLVVATFPLVVVAALPGTVVGVVGVVAWAKAELPKPNVSAAASRREEDFMSRREKMERRSYQVGSVRVLESYEERE
jgi:hypothetical protein